MSSGLRGVLDGSRQDPGARTLIRLLEPLAALYGASAAIRAELYRSGMLSSRRLPRPVISIGNLTAGGTGKTPVTVLVARMLQQAGRKPAVLSRGYGGSLQGKFGLVSDGRQFAPDPSRAGDEPVLLARKLPGVPVAVGADRYQSGLRLLELVDVEVFILDDGFQHLKLSRDLNILLLDDSRPFGNGRILPAGLLREPTFAGDRADLVIRTRCASGFPQPLWNKPTLGARHRLGRAMPLRGGEGIPLASLAGNQAAAFAGVADPEAFFHSLREAGIVLRETMAFPDHVPYGERERTLIERLSAGGRPVFTTEKDAVKLADPSTRELPIFAVELEIELTEAAPLASALQALFPSGE